MDSLRSSRHSRISRAIQMLALGVAPWLKTQASAAGPDSSVNESAAPSTYDASNGIPQPNAPQPEDPRQLEPRAVDARRRTIDRDATAILAECERAAGRDWEKWQRDTVPYRAALKARIDALRDLPQLRDPLEDLAYEALEGRDGFPLFEIGSRRYLRYLCDPILLDSFRRDRQVVAARNWLSDRGIDLIFVPIPRMTEVYIEHFLDPCPPDGIIAPHVRKTLLEMLKDDVEVVDCWSLLRSMRNTDSEFLYNATDAHWAPRGMRIVAKEIADRIERYNFGARARFALPIVRTLPGPYTFRDIFGKYTNFGRDILSPEQAQRAAAAQTTNQAEVRMQDGKRPPADADSPVIVIGHSYVWHFREQLIKELNLVIDARVVPDQTTECFADFLRQPELLAHTRVIVWVTTEQHMTRFKPLPKPVADRLHVATSRHDTN
jgi:hypothetical protein